MKKFFGKIPFSEVTQSTCVFDHVAFVICVAVKE